MLIMQVRLDYPIQIVPFQLKLFIGNISIPPGIFILTSLNPLSIDRFILKQITDQNVFIVFEFVSIFYDARIESMCIALLYAT